MMAQCASKDHKYQYTDQHILTSKATINSKRLVLEFFIFLYIQLPSSHSKAQQFTSRGLQCQKYISCHETIVDSYSLTILKSIITLLQIIRVYIQLLLLVPSAYLANFHIKYPSRKLSLHLLQLYFPILKQQETLV